MPKFRKKPVVIEAVQFTGENHEEIMDFMDGRLIVGIPQATKPRLEDGVIIIKTLEGGMTASVGDWIIKGVQGEFYPCKPDIFLRQHMNRQTKGNQMAKSKTTALQIAVYDMGKNDLPEKLIREVEDAVTAILKTQTTVAHLVARA